MKRKQGKTPVSIIHYGNRIVGGFDTVAQGKMLIVMLEECNGNVTLINERYEWYLGFNPDIVRVLDNISIIRNGGDIELPTVLRRMDNKIRKRIKERSKAL